MLLLWIGISWLLIVSQGRPETFLRTSFATYSRPEAFYDLNRTMAYFWVVHSCLTLIALSATWFRRTDVLVVLLIGPAMALGLNVLSQRWSDPHWAVFVGVCLMGWLASTLVSLVYWVYSLTSRRSGPRPAPRSASGEV
jgi:hypothetical protein